MGPQASPPSSSWDPYAGGGPAPVETVRNGLGVAALVLGILSLVFMLLFPPVGVVVGILALVFGIGLQLVPHEGANSPYGGLALIAMFSGFFIMMGFLWAVIGE